MRLVWLLWGVCSGCLLLALLASAVTYHPDAQHLFPILLTVFGGGAVLAGAAAVALGRLPPSHWVHESKPVWAAAVAVAVVVFLLPVMVG